MNDAHMTQQSVSHEVALLDEFLIEELETRLEMETCYHFTCQERDWQGQCTNYGYVTSISYNVTPAQCTAEGDSYTQW